MSDSPVLERDSSLEKIRHPDFARRMESACDGNPDVPPLNYGRLTWFVDRMAKEGANVSIEAVRRWFSGDARPRHYNIVILARILKVDEAWLATGKRPDIEDRARRQNRVVAEGVAMVVAGYIQMHGGHPAFPQDDDREAQSTMTNLYAIIRGAKYSFHVTAALGEGEKAHFVAPFAARDTIILGVVPVGPFCVEVFELDWAQVEEVGQRRNDTYVVGVNAAQWRKVETFSERF